MSNVSAEELARAFHESYERLAPSFGYETRRESAVPWEQVPEANRQLMIAVCRELLESILADRSPAPARANPKPSRAAKRGAPSGQP